MTNPGQDPRLLPSTAHAKASDVESRLVAHLSSHPAAAPALAYGQTSSQVTQTVNGTYTWTCPAGVTSAKIECVGAGAGGGGGSGTRGGEGGGGGEYASEPSYPVVPGQVYTYIVGNGGSGGTTGNSGQDGGATLFDTTASPGGVSGGVFANGGGAGSGFTGGAGGGTAAHGGPSPNTVHRNGGKGGGTGSQGTGGCGGGGGGGVTSAGGNGSTSGSSTGAAGGAGGGAPGGGAGGAGGNSAANGVTSVQSGGGGGGAGASTSATSGTSTYRLNSSAAYFGSDATGGNANQKRSDGTIYQGGETASGGSYNGTQKSLGIIGGNSQGDLSGKTIDQVTIRLEWTHTWYNNGAYVILGYTGRTSLPGSWDASGITGVKTWWQGSVGNAVTTDLTGQGLGTALQNGSAQSLSFGPGSSYNLNNYGFIYGAGGDNNQNPLITVQWHTGTAPTQAGGGCDGKVIISYNVAGVLLAAVQAAPGTDDAGNAFSTGYTGQVQAFAPGSSPAVVETWHDMRPLSGGMIGSISGQYPPQYRLRADGTVEVAGNVQLPSSAGNYNGVGFYTMPAAYRPNKRVQWFASDIGDGAATPKVQVASSGVVTLQNLPTSSSNSIIGIFGSYPLDSSGLIQS
jgi:hypothetical protein